MPHSEPVESDVREADEVKMEEDVAVPTEAQRQSPAKEDVDMADVAPEPIAVAEENPNEESKEDGTSERTKEDVKLEDLFADVDSDDEFPNSRPADGTPSSSSPGENTPTSR